MVLQTWRQPSSCDTTTRTGSGLPALDVVAVVMCGYTASQIADSVAAG
jgi:hypothetical protein